MRFVSVLGAIGVGLAIGSAAVLAPLTIGTPNSGSAGSSGSTGAKSNTASGNNASGNVASGAAQWASQWGHQAVNTVRSLTSTSARTTAATGEPKTSQDAQAGGPAVNSQSASKVADARIVQTPWATQVAVAPEAVPPKRLTSSKPSSDEQRHNLVRDLQLELKRVGCYEGEPNGQWGAASKKAMASFTERVNASLPFEQPDLILLTLVQGHKGRACGQDCPNGQSITSNGRCIPNSILAQTERSKQGDTIKREAVAGVAAANSAGVAAANSSTKTPSIASAWTTTTAPTPLETGSVVAAVPAPVRVTRPQQAPQQTAVLAPPATPANPQGATPQASVTAEIESPARPAIILPGRMAIGAPLPPVLEPAPVPAVKPSPATRLATVATQTATPSSPEPVTAATEAAPAPPAKHGIRSQPIVRSQPVVRAQPAPVHVAPHVVKRAPEPVVVRRPPPSPRNYVAQYAGNTYGNNVNGSKSRRMVYEMFQRPDRN